MREILFKAKRLDNGEWVEGYFIKKHGIPFIYENAECPQSNYEIDENTLCQYTGLTDKNGKKIWENDVVVEDFGNCKGTVVFGEFASNVLNNLGFSIDWSRSGVYYRQDLPYWVDKIEVIGNIFDDLELLKECQEQNAEEITVQCKCSTGYGKCIVDMDAQQTLGGQIVCDVAEECDFDKSLILKRCEYAVTKEEVTADD